MFKKFLRATALLFALAVVVGVVGFFGFGLPLLGLPLMYGIIASGSLALASLALWTSSFFTKKPIKSSHKALQIDEMTRREYQLEIQDYQRDLEEIMRQPSWFVRTSMRLWFGFLGLWHGIAKKEAILSQTQSTTTLVIRPLEKSVSSQSSTNYLSRLFGEVVDWKLKGQQVVDQLLLEDTTAADGVTIAQRGARDRLAIRHLLEIIKNYLTSANAIISLTPRPMMSDFEQLDGWVKSVIRATTYRYHPDKNANNPTVGAFSSEFNAILGVLKTFIQPNQCGLYQMLEDPMDKYDQIESLLKLPYTLILYNNQFYYVNKTKKTITECVPFFEDRSVAHREKKYALKAGFPVVGEYKLADGYEFNLMTKFAPHISWDGKALEIEQISSMRHFIELTDSLGYRYKLMDAEISGRGRRMESTDRINQAPTEPAAESETDKLCKHFGALFEELERDRQASKEFMKGYQEREKALQKAREAREELAKVNEKAREARAKAREERAKANDEFMKGIEERKKALEERKKAFEEEKRKKALEELDKANDELPYAIDESCATPMQVPQVGQTVSEQCAEEKKIVVDLVASVELQNADHKPICKEEESFAHPSQDAALKPAVEENLSGIDVTDGATPAMLRRSNSSNEYSFTSGIINTASCDGLETDISEPLISDAPRERMLTSGGRLNFLASRPISPVTIIDPFRECNPF